MVSAGAHPKNKCFICDNSVFSLIFWDRKHAFKLNPVFTNHTDSNALETIRYQVEKLPAGMFPVDDRNSETNKEKGTKTDKARYDPGLGYDNGVLDYDELED
jgi:hypothetical protein